jgi:hypothetical protein
MWALVLCDVRVGHEVIEDDAGAGEGARADAFEREEGVVDAAKAVGDDGDDGQSEADSEVGEGLGFSDGDEPTAGTFDD